MLTIGNTLNDARILRFWITCLHLLGIRVPEKPLWRLMTFKEVAFGIFEVLSRWTPSILQHWKFLYSFAFGIKIKLGFRWMPFRWWNPWRAWHKQMEYLPLYLKFLASVWSMELWWTPSILQFQNCNYYYFSNIYFLAYLFFFKGFKLSEISQKNPLWRQCIS